MRLTEQQRSFFKTFGYLAFPGLFSDEADQIIEGFEQVWADYGGGHDGKLHDHERRSALLPFIDENEFLSSLLDDPRIVGPVASIMGDDFNYTASDGNYYVGDTAWHSDGYRDKKYLSCKMAFYLDPVTSDTGCLRVIPGSHKWGDRFGNALDEVVQSPRGDQQTQELWGINGKDVPAAALEVEPGDLVMFNHCIKHASFGGGTKRRMFTINFEERYVEEDVPLLRDVMAQETRFWIEKAYGDVMVDTAGPERMVHLEQRLANDDHLAELGRKARQEMEEPARG